MIMFFFFIRMTHTALRFHQCEKLIIHDVLRCTEFDFPILYCAMELQFVGAIVSLTLQSLTWLSSAQVIR